MKKILFSVIYRTGYINVAEKETFLTEIETFLSSIQNPNIFPIVCGDFNVHVCKRSDGFVTDFCNLFEQMGFCQLVKSPTHVEGNILDLIFIQETDKVQRINIFNEMNPNVVPLSDHFLIELSLICKSKEEANVVSFLHRNTKDVNHGEFTSDVIARYEFLCQENSALLRVENLFTSINESLDNFAPKTPKTIKISSKPFTDNNIIKARKIKRRAERKYKKHKTEENKKALKCASKELLKVVKTSHNRYYSDKLKGAKNNPKETYRIINHLLFKKNTRILPKTTNNIVLANEFAEFFKQKVNNIREEIINKQNRYSITYQASRISSTYTNIEPLSNFNEITLEMLEETIKSTKTKYSANDDIPRELLDALIKALLPIILDIVNQSICEGIFPDYLKSSIIIPIPKDPKSDTDSLASFRPIANLSFLSNPIEKTALSQLMYHLERNNLLSNRQSAYKKNIAVKRRL